MPKRVLFAIAVSRPEKLEELPGALDAAQWMATWAAKADFAAHVITDEKDDVTVERLNAAFMPVLRDASTTIEHLILHFVGHGVARDADDQFLLLSKWWTQPTESIKLSRFTRLLQDDQPERVTLFVDACRSRQSLKTEEIDGSGVLFVSNDEPQEFAEDRFRAAPYGRDAFMVRDSASGRSFCMFSTILLKVLCGGYDDAVTTRNGDRVVASAQISKALTLHYPKAAGAYGKQVKPSLRPGFLDPDDVYTRLPVDCVPPDLPPPPPTEVRRDAFPRPPAPPNADVLAEARQQEIASGYAAEERPTHYESGSGCAVIGAPVVGASVMPPLVVESDRNAANGSWWRFRSEPGFFVQRGGSLLIQIGGGTWIGSAVIPGTIVTFTVGPYSEQQNAAIPVGAQSVIYRPSESMFPPLMVAEASVRSEKIIAAFRAGRLRGDDALDVAALIRTDKHVDPVLGVVAADFYDSVGDRDSIRRIAFFFTVENQPIPFDVALLADLRGSWGDGHLRVAVPAVRRREPRTAAEIAHQDYFADTAAVDDALVTNGFPWLRQGWDLLDTARRFRVHPAVVDIAKTRGAVLPFPFVTLSLDAGRFIAGLIEQREI